MEKIEFTSNYTDLSTDTGFQFEFVCERCDSGYRTRFQPFTAGKISSALDAASSLFGGVFNQAADMGERVRSARWQTARDEAFMAAVSEVRHEFVQCPRCNNWVCKEKCWNTRKGLCKECAPDLGVEMAAAQASRSVEEVWSHAAMAEEDKKLATENWRQTIMATCPECNQPLAANAKFCPNCGAALKKDKFCPNCGAKVLPGAKFCQECGTKMV